MRYNTRILGSNKRSKLRKLINTPCSFHLKQDYNYCLICCYHAQICPYKSMLCNMTDFQSLVNQNIFSWRGLLLYKNTPKLKRHAFNVDIFEGTNQQSLNPRILSLKRRSITDIFTPYTVSSIGNTANRNYLFMNKTLKQ